MKKKKKVAVRKKWKISPVTKVEKVEVSYDRKKEKQQLRKMLESDEL